MLWKEEKNWYISWSGTTIWGEDYSDSAYFNNEEEALAFSHELLEKETVDYVNLNESIAWRKK